MLKIMLTKNEASRLALFALGHPWCSQNSLQHTCGLHPPAALWRFMSLPTSSSQSQSSSSSSSSLSSSPSPSSVLTSSHMHDWQFSVTSPSLAVSVSCVNSLQTNTDVYIATNDCYSHEKYNIFIPTNDFTRLALHEMFLASLVFKQACMRMSLPLKDGLRFKLPSSPHQCCLLTCSAVTYIWVPLTPIRWTHQIRPAGSFTRDKPLCLLPQQISTWQGITQNLSGHRQPTYW